MLIAIVDFQGLSSKAFWPNTKSGSNSMRRMKVNWWLFQTSVSITNNDTEKIDQNVAAQGELAIRFTVENSQKWLSSSWHCCCHHFLLKRLARHHFLVKWLVWYAHGPQTLLSNTANLMSISVQDSSGVFRSCHPFICQCSSLVTAPH